ncbi:MAG TPA: S8 family serine peptidase [Terriglobales bacterium]
MKVVRCLLTGCLVLTIAAWAAGTGNGVLVHLRANQVTAFDTAHNTTATRLNSSRDLYLITSNSGLSDQQLLTQVKTDPRAGDPTINAVITFDGQSTASVLNGQSTASVLNGQSTASVLNGQSTASVLNGQSTASVLNGQSTASVLNGHTNLSTGSGKGNKNTSLDGQSTASVLNGQSTASVLNGQSTASVLNGEVTVLQQSTASVLNEDVNFYGTRAPAAYVNQAAVSQVAAGAPALQKATGEGAVVALIDNGVDQFNPVLRKSLLGREGWNFYDNTPNWSAWADLGQSTASVLNGQSTASVLNWLHNFPTCPNGSGSTTSSSDGQSTASVLNGSTQLDQSTASVLNGKQTLTNLVLSLIEKILQCDPDFGHGTAVAGMIHVIAPEAKILPIRAFGPGGVATAAAIYESITYAIDQHADVINMSFSSTGLDPNVGAAVQEAVSKGIIVVAAAGNGGISDPVYPASLPGVVGVGAVDGCGAATPTGACIANPPLVRAGFSNFDPASGIVDADVAAPGVQLLTTFPGFGLIWATSSGTSFSSPIVAGEAAQLVELRQTGAQNRADVENSADPSIPGDLDGGLGHGLVQVLGALKLAPTPAPGHGHGHGH